MVSNKERHSGLCGKVSELPIGKIWALEAYISTSENAYFGIEVEENSHGLCGRSS